MDLVVQIKENVPMFLKGKRLGEFLFRFSWCFLLLFFWIFETLLYRLGFLSRAVIIVDLLLTALLLSLVSFLKANWYCQIAEGIKRPQAVFGGKKLLKSLWFELILTVYKAAWLIAFLSFSIAWFAAYFFTEHLIFMFLFVSFAAAGLLNWLLFCRRYRYCKLLFCKGDGILNSIRKSEKIVMKNKALIRKFFWFHPSNACRQAFFCLIKREEI